MEASSGTVYAIQQRIISKLLAIDATSIIKAVTAQRAHLDIQETNDTTFQSTTEKTYFTFTIFCDFLLIGKK